jgi:hypothetical protein
MIEFTLDRYVSGVATANCDMIGMLAREAAAPKQSIATIGSARPGIQGKDPTEIPMSPIPTTITRSVMSVRQSQPARVAPTIAPAPMLDSSAPRYQGGSPRPCLTRTGSTTNSGARKKFSSIATSARANSTRTAYKNWKPRVRSSIQRATTDSRTRSGSKAPATPPGRVFAITAHRVTQRTEEIGIRMALGADAGDVVRMFLRGTLRLLALAIVLGLAWSLALGTLIRSLSQEVVQQDPMTLTIVVVVLGSVTLLATLIPARRGARVDPVVALRAE